jgi:hypothetical protein
MTPFLFNIEGYGEEASKNFSGKHIYDITYDFYYSHEYHTKHD